MTTPKIRVTPIMIRGMKDHLNKIQETLDLMSPIPEVGGMARGAAEHKLKILLDSRISMRQKVANLGKETFQTPEEMNQAASKMAHKIVMMGKQVVSLQADPSIRTQTMEEVLGTLGTLKEEEVANLSKTPAMTGMTRIVATTTAATGETTVIWENPATGKTMAAVDPATMTGPTRGQAQGPLDLSPTGGPWNLSLRANRDLTRQRIQTLERAMMRVAEKTGDPTRPTIPQEARTMANHLLKAIEGPKKTDPLNPDLTWILEASLEIGIVRVRAIPEVRILLKVAESRDQSITAWDLTTLDRHLAMIEQAKTHRVYPLLMRQTAHRLRSQVSMMHVKMELQNSDQRIFLTAEPLMMLLT